MPLNPKIQNPTSTLNLVAKFPAFLGLGVQGSDANVPTSGRPNLGTGFRDKSIPVAPFS